VLNNIGPSTSCGVKWANGWSIATGCRAEQTRPSDLVCGHRGSAFRWDNRPADNHGFHEYPYGAIPVTVQLSVTISPEDGYGGWLYGAGVMSSTARVKTFAPIIEPSAGMT
jgi:hypothetical protein